MYWHHLAKEILEKEIFPGLDPDLRVEVQEKIFTPYDGGVAYPKIVLVQY